MNSGNNNGFRAKDTNTQGTIGERLGGGFPIVDRSQEDFSSDICGRRSPFTDITFEECDSVVGTVLLLSDLDPKVAADLLVCSLAIYCRDCFTGPEDRGDAFRGARAALSIAFEEYDRRMGGNIHDFMECLESVPWIVIDDEPDSDFYDEDDWKDDVEYRPGYGDEYIDSDDDIQYLDEDDVCDEDGGEADECRNCLHANGCPYRGPRGGC